VNKAKRCDEGGGGERVWKVGAAGEVVACGAATDVGDEEGRLR
jgi:hypothetical protein